MKKLLGVKGANLAEMTGMGLPVPYGFVATTNVCKQFLESKGKLSYEIKNGISRKIEEIEEITGKKFGSGDNPLLVSVRASSVVNIPTMKAAVLNLGLNDANLEGLAAVNGNMEFALDTYCRLIRMYGTVVRRIPQKRFISAYENLKKNAVQNGKCNSKEQLLAEAVKEYKKIILLRSGRAFPQDPYEQLTEAIGAVFNYWNSEENEIYRELHEISDDIGVACVVQSMVFGNLDERSCIGTVFTREPEKGEKKTCGSFMIKAQGGDVPFGYIEEIQIDEMEGYFPNVYKQFLKIASLLENYNKNMQEIEFAVEHGKLYILQTRKGRRSPSAAVKIAVDMVDEQIVDRETAVAGIKADDINKLVVWAFKDSESIDEYTALNFDKILSWADEFRTMGVRANIDTTEDVAIALKLGAEGVGLCRSEHMFFDEDRIYEFTKMIIAENREERKDALNALKPYQLEDFKKIFEIMEDRPVTIRLLDPSLHKFLPHNEKDLNVLAEKLNISANRLAVKIGLLEEENPAMGRRGSRLAVSYPEIVKMQTEAIMMAAMEVKEQKGTDVNVAIMIPFVSTVREFAYVRKTVDEVAAECFKSAGKSIEYSVGTMIETPRAALLADKIAEKADFFSMGTNDLTELVFGLSQYDTEELIDEYVRKDLLDKNPFKSLDERGVGSLIIMAAEKGRKVKPKLKIGLCGDHGGDTSTIEFCCKNDMNYVSCSTLRIAGARLAAAQAAIKASHK